ncbi:MAG TPA: NAD(P)-dependent oxidoreductase [Methylomirabilota bacterium]|nr:NAD(P)-dependent oxidoreductase [Methylomirabilota bacterium]
MSKPVVAFLDPHGPEVRAAIQAECPPEVVLRLATSSDPAERASLVGDAEFLVGGITPIPASLIQAAPRLRLIHKWGIGVDKIDLAAAQARGVPVAITAGANAVPVAEFTLLLVLAVLRRLSHREAQLRAGEWQRAREETRAQARQLRGKLVALIGMGAIGREVARRLRAFDAEVRYFDVRRLAPDEERALGVRFGDLEALLSEADIVSLHVPLLPSTRRLLSRERIARLRPQAVVINTARGELVDEAALAEALDAGRLAGAGLDVFGTEPPPADHPLLRVKAPGLVLAPHLAGSVIDNVGNMARHVFANIRRVLDGEPIPARDLVFFGGVSGDPPDAPP